MDKLLTLPDAPTLALSIRAKALLLHDPRSTELLAHVERVARSEATVLVIGETGTGKELIARHIHAQSGRKGPFIAVNCGAFSENLIDAELFGHESGAYTGASQSRAGWFEAANGGTLFLDEIGDLPLSLQVKLLRVLQERQVVRLGSRRAVPLDVRLVAATNIDLHKAVEAQRFRADLYYRLSVATVPLPPLRERPGDIVPLARHFIGIYGGKLGLEQVALAPDAHAALLAYPWPGNIRELENAVHYALIVCRDAVLRAEDFRFAPTLASTLAVASPAQAVARNDDGKAWRGHGFGAATHEPDESPAPAPLGELVQAIRGLIGARQAELFHHIESAVVRTAFAHCDDNQVQTARLLGITRNTLRTLLKRHGLLGEPAHLAHALEPAADHTLTH